jgi:hypothetical protein
MLVPRTINLPYYQFFVGALGGIRTPDPQIRSLEVKTGLGMIGLE